jgi:hypothetical protein
LRAADAAAKLKCDDPKCDDNDRSAVMSSLRKFAPATRRRIVAALACAALAAGPALAAGRHAPHHASQPAAQGPGQAGSTPAGQAKPEGGTGPIDTTAAKTTPNEPADHGKTTDSKSVGPIDLTRPDDGYANLRRRAARTSLIAAQRKPAIAAPGTPITHPLAATTAEHTRNAAGSAVPVAPALPAAIGAARPEPVHAESVPGFGGPKNNLGLSTGTHLAPVHVATTPAAPKPPVPGINGTSLHQGGPGIGGPATDRSAIGGSLYRHK